MVKINKVYWKDRVGNKYQFDEIVKCEDEDICKECKKNIYGYKVLYKVYNTNKKRFRNNNVCLSCALKLWNDLIQDNFDFKDYEKTINKIKKDYGKYLLVESI